MSRGSESEPLPPCPFFIQETHETKPRKQENRSIFKISTTMRHRSYTIILIHWSPEIEQFWTYQPYPYFPNNAKFRLNAIHAVQLINPFESIPILPQPALTFPLPLDRIGRCSHRQFFLVVTSSAHISTSS